MGCIPRITYLALGQLGLDSRPSLALGSITEEVHNNGTLADGLVDLEEVLARDPAVLYRILPGLAVLSDTDDDVQPVIAEVQTLAVTLGTVADQSECVVLEVILCRWSAQTFLILPLERVISGQKPTKSFSLGQSARSRDGMVSDGRKHGCVQQLTPLTVNLLGCTSEVNCLHTPHLLLGNTGHSRASPSGSSSD